MLSGQFRSLHQAGGPDSGESPRGCVDFDDFRRIIQEAFTPEHQGVVVADWAPSGRRSENRPEQHLHDPEPSRPAQPLALVRGRGSLFQPRALWRENEWVTGYPATPLRVVWSELDPKRYEDLVSALLSILHPTSIRTDGSGGDGGRDVHFPGPEGLEIFELKSFTRRVTTNRWKQVKRSLKRAMEMAPKTWTVVCPIDLTREERG
jgi:hypothetical protein